MTVGSKLKGVNQPHGGYLSRLMFSTIVYSDCNKVKDINDELKGVQELVVYHLTRFMVLQDIHIFDKLIKTGTEEECQHLIESIRGIDDTSIHNIVDLISINTGEKYIIDSKFYSNIKTLTNRVLHFLEDCKEIVATDVEIDDFKKISDITVLPYITRDAIIDVQCSRQGVFKHWSLNVIAYYILGMKSSNVSATIMTPIATSFRGVEKIVLFDSYTNIAYICNISDIDGVTLNQVKEVIDSLLSNIDEANNTVNESHNEQIEDTSDMLAKISKEDYIKQIEKITGTTIKVQSKFFETIQEVIVLRRNGYTMYMFQKETGVFLLQGLKAIKLSKKLGYYCDTLDKYSNVAKHIFEPYFSTLVDISNKIKGLLPEEEYLQRIYNSYKQNYRNSIFGLEDYDTWCKNYLLDQEQYRQRGKIDGCTIYIDTNNYIYISPIDYSIKAYHIVSKQEHTPYDSIVDLFKESNSELLSAYLNIADMVEHINKHTKYEAILNKLEETMSSWQQFYFNKVVLQWNEEILNTFIEPDSSDVSAVTSDIPTTNKANSKFNKYIGLERTMNCGEKARVIDYIGCKNATIQFEDGTIRYNVRIDDFKRGKVAKNSKRGVNKK